MRRLIPATLAALTLGITLIAALPLSAETIIKVGSHTDFSYAYVDKDGSMTVGSGNSDEWESIPRGNPGQGFLWFKQAGKAYIVRDPARLAPVKASLAPILALSEKMDKMGRRMDSYSEAMDSLTTQMQLTDHRDGDEHDPLQRDIEETSKVMGELGDRMGALGDEQEALVKKAEPAIYQVAQDALKAGAAEELK